MKKTLAALLSVAVLLAGAVSAEAKITLKVANSGPDTLENRTVCAADVYTDMVKKATNGEVELVFYHASKLGGEAEALEGIQMGTIEMGTLTSGPASNFFPQTMAFDIPYLISSNAAGWEFFKSDFVKKLSDEFLKRTGVRILAVAEHGFRHFTSNAPEMKTPADMKGLKMRVMENPAHMAMTRGLGSSPTPIPYSELYMALQQGVVDGMECPIANIHDHKFYEVQDSMVLDGHLYGPLLIFINEDKFQSLSKSQQEALYKGAEAFCTVHAGITAASSPISSTRSTSGPVSWHHRHAALRPPHAASAAPRSAESISHSPRCSDFTHRVCAHPAISSPRASNVSTALTGSTTTLHQPSATHARRNAASADRESTSAARSIFASSGIATRQFG